jgi:hypothetical protein
MGLESKYGSPRAKGARARVSVSGGSLTLMRTLYMETGPRKSLSTLHQVAKVDPFGNCRGEEIFLLTPVLLLLKGPDKYPVE